MNLVVIIVCIDAYLISVEPLLMSVLPSKQDVNI